jgi:hypothetical protein
MSCSFNLAETQAMPTTGSEIPLDNEALPNKGIE